MNKRRWSTLLLAFLLLLPLAACGKKEPGSASSAPDSASGSEKEPDISAIAPVEPAPYTGPVNPLTGEPAEEGLAARRPYAVMLNNLRKALPQVGVSKADVIYEIVAEGGITRMMAVFQDLEGVGDLACIRSARDYYVSLAVGHDAIYIHAGGSPQAYQAFKDLKTSNIDFVNGPYGKMCWRDPDRRKSAGLEHSLFTSSEKVLEQLPERFAREHSDGFEVGWTFDQEAPAGGQPAARLTVPFSSYKTGHFTYDAASGEYSIEQHIDKKDIPYVDGGNDADVTVSNVLVLYTDVNRVKGDDKGRMAVRTTGKGDGLLLRDGQLYEITWERDSERACYAFLDSSGKPIPLAVGRSYINIVGTGAEVTWE
ncbi:DUF3048 domain-containing protein [Colidextribacter sp. OB.20]|uniref:DUF3048 domain-containing protein n=1 Tax=Colidextribacter sp. OB.20 TaxID=2304568 RepID=UPI00136E092A|nr:DUF3048 domain-containing protein [Colidextribacter sp. OB.20]NBI11530.1 DUF3048 domain-containing protein [Colidextribacter sp. OB.20]